MYRPIRTGTTAKYGTNSRDQSYVGRGHSSVKSSSSRGGGGGGSGSGSQLTCPACGYSTQYKRDMHQHIQSRHGGKVSRPKAVANPAEQYVPGGSAGEAAASSKWGDLHKTDTELAAEFILRDQMARGGGGGGGSGGYHGKSQPSRFERAKKSASGLFQKTRSAISNHGISSGTRGVANNGRKKKKKKKRAKV